MFRKKDNTLSEASVQPATSPTARTKVLPPVPIKAAPVKTSLAKFGSAKSGSPKSGLPQSGLPQSGPTPLPAAKSLQAGSKGKQAYEARRAEKAGMGLEKWMAEKDRRVQAEREALQRARRKAEPEKRGLLRRLLDKAHRPI